MIKKGLFLVFFTGSVAISDTHYVDLNSASPTAPYTNWVTAAHMIQEAVDSAENGDEVLVADGLYNSGSRVAPDQVLCENRVVIDKAVTVRSVNGAEKTIIEGKGPGGDSAIRGVWMADGAVLNGFTVTNGYTTTLGDSYVDADGGGIFCVSTNALIANSIIVNNVAYNGGGSYYGSLTNCMFNGNIASSEGGGAYRSSLSSCILGKSYASYNGGGVYDGVLSDCELTDNSAEAGGGSYSGVLNDCVLSNNSASSRGGGSCYGSLNNCILSGNSASGSGGGSYKWSLVNCAIIGNSSPRGGGSRSGTLRNSIVYGNTNGDIVESTYSFCCTNNPHFMDAASGNYRLAADSPCRDAGLNAFVTTTTDLDGNLRIVNGTVDIGAYEYQGDDLHYITATAGEHGAILPSGKINAPAGTNLVFVIAPETYYQAADVLTNGVSAGAVGATGFVWPDIQADGTLSVSFDALLATNSVPV
ncbi:MAG: hypothetical protein JXR40_06100 [Pontiellaceae bacterium]|nr:hypothetical protein [Pontiellaceae bacterium]